jgi:hypothetical protein
LPIVIDLTVIVLPRYHRHRRRGLLSLHRMSP